MKIIQVLAVLYLFLALVGGLFVAASVFVFHVVVAPLLFKYCKRLRYTIVFANFFQWPINTDFEEPSSRGIKGARNLSIEYQSKVDACPIKIGIWHILPKSALQKLGPVLTSLDKEALNVTLDEELASSPLPVILYCHGNSNSRAAHHRIILYEVFQQLDFHVIAFDYRGYGDSTNLQPTEDGVVEDTLVVYEWLRSIVDRHSNARPVYIWGHSLGTGISSHLVGNMESLCSKILERTTLPQPTGLILESPFNNLRDEVAHHPLSKLVTWLPYFEAMFVTPFTLMKEFSFKSDEHLARITSLPVLILHAKDDYIVPYQLGAKLYNYVKRAREAGGADIELHSYEKLEKLGHKWICNASDLPNVITNFTTTHK